MRKQLTKLLAVGMSVMTLMGSMTLPVYAEESTSSYLYEQAGIELNTETVYTMGDGVEGYLSTDGKTLVVKGSGSLTDTSTLPTGIVTIYIESGITSIEETASFTSQYQTLTNVYFAEGLQTITSANNFGKPLFQNCTLIKEIVLPDSLETVSAWTFYGCTGLQSLTLGKNLTTFDSSALQGSCTNLKYLNINCKKVTDSINLVYVDNTTESLVITFGDSVEIIESLNIATNKNVQCDIESITIPKSVTCINSGAIKVYLGAPQEIMVYTDNQVAKDYDWAGNYITATIISSAQNKNMVATVSVSTVTDLDITIPVSGIGFQIDSSGNISSEGVVIESNTAFPLTVSVASVTTLDNGDTTNGLGATTTTAPTLVSADTYTKDEWNKLTAQETRAKIALAIKQVDVNENGTASTALTEATTDTSKVTTPVELGKLGTDNVLAHIESGYGETAKIGINLETDTAYTNYGKTWLGSDEVVFRYLVTLEFRAD